MRSIKSKYSKLKKDTLVLTVGNFSSKCLQFFMLPVYTSILSTTEYGIVDLIITLSNLLYPVLSLNVAESVLRFMLDEDEDKRKVFPCICRYFLICILGAIIMTTILFYSKTFKEYRFWLLAYLLSNTLYLAISAYAKGLGKIEIYAWASVISSFSCVCLSVLFLFVFHKGIYGYMMSFIASFIVASVYLLLSCRIEIINSISRYCIADRELFKKMFFYALPLVPNSISWWISNSTDKFILKEFYDVASVGIYSVAYKIPAVVGVICNNFIAAWQLSSVEGFGTEQTREFYCKTYRIFTGGIIILTCLIVEFSQIITKTFIGKDFNEAKDYIPILVIGALFCNTSAFLGSVFTAGKTTKYLFYSTSIGAIINICLNIILIPLVGVYGAAIATAFSYFVVWVYRIYKSKQMYNLNFSNGKEMLCYILLIVQAYFVINNWEIFWTFIPMGLILLLLKSSVYKFIIDICIK